MRGLPAAQVVAVESPALRFGDAQTYHWLTREQDRIAKLRSCDGRRSVFAWGAPLTYGPPAPYYSYVHISWDEQKNLSNQQKHGLSFEQGAALLDSGRVYEIYDGMYENQEQRFIAFGEISSGVIGVVFAEYDDERVRIISVRPATRSEVSEYRKYMDTLL